MTPLCSLTKTALQPPTPAHLVVAVVTSNRAAGTSEILVGRWIKVVKIQWYFVHISLKETIEKWKNIMFYKVWWGPVRPHGPIRSDGPVVRGRAPGKFQNCLPNETSISLSLYILIRNNWENREEHKKMSQNRVFCLYLFYF